jgi:hypothetical protein
MKPTTTTQVSADGVMQANGGRDEELDPGMERGGWATPLFDNEAMTFVNQVYQRADAFLFGRRKRPLRRLLGRTVGQPDRRCVETRGRSMWHRTRSPTRGPQALRRLLRPLVTRPQG